MKPKNVKCRQTLFGKDEVTYDCPGCGKSLKNDLDDVGMQDQCPHCECDFVVPGLRYKQEIERRRAERSARKEARNKERLEPPKNEDASVDSPSQTQSDTEKNAIHYISEGLGKFVSAFFYSILAGFFGNTASSFGTGISDASPDDQAFLLLMMLVFAALSVVNMVRSYLSIKLSIDAFEKGSEP